MAKRKTGPRTKSGRRKDRTSPFDYGNEKVGMRAAQFACFGGGREQLYDSIGRLWTVGLLENDRIDAAALREIGREYASRYWGHYGTAVGVANYEGETRRGSGLADETTPDPAGEIFQRMFKRLIDAGIEAETAVNDLCVNGYASPDHDAGWVERLVNEALLRKNRPIAGMLPFAGDKDMLAHAVSGLLALAEGQSLRRAA